MFVLFTMSKIFNISFEKVINKFKSFDKISKLFVSNNSLKIFAIKIFTLKYFLSIILLILSKKFLFNINFFPFD